MDQLDKTSKDHNSKKVSINPFSNKEYPIPSEIDDLDAIIKLRIQNNKLSGNIPSTICDLSIINSGAYWFNLDSNYLCPPYPDCLEDLEDNQQITNCK